ncbi:MAG: galactosamine-6-phosphate isomerase [Tannerella sp.]|jgi:galactosamine-6-phosphate isomerase|nr:galactosamine-6-phosphate isomerase [Tannerella sp.]
MNIEICNTYEEISCKAKQIVTNDLMRNQTLLLCAATGGSPTRMYEMFIKEYTVKPDVFSQMRVIKLDEWGGIPMQHAGTCESYLQRHVIQPMRITEERYISFQSQTNDPLEECWRIQQELDQKGPIDVCVLGLGMNGHVALNEPADFLQPECHVADLSFQSLQHPMISSGGEKPTYGLTLGIANIMLAKRIIMLINGAHKQEITRQFLTKKITTQLPASLLWLHPNVDCLIDKEAAGV